MEASGTRTPEDSSVSSSRAVGLVTKNRGSEASRQGCGAKTPEQTRSSGVIVRESCARADTLVTSARATDEANSTETTKNRSEEHTSELQSPCNLVCRLLLEKKKKQK